MSGSSVVEIQDSLVTADWLVEYLGIPGLRVFDCSCILVPDPDTVFSVKSGSAQYEEEDTSKDLFLLA